MGSIPAGRTIVFKTWERSSGCNGFVSQSVFLYLNLFTSGYHKNKNLGYKIMVLNLLKISVLLHDCVSVSQNNKYAV